MNPELIAASQSEHAQQAAFFCWLANNAQRIDPRLMFAFAIPNGGERNAAVASRLKAEGVKAGVPDIFIPIPTVHLTHPPQANQANQANQTPIHTVTYHGLWLEFKRPQSTTTITKTVKKQGELSQHQIKWREYLISQNYAHFVVYTYLQAVTTTLNYLGIVLDENTLTESV